MNRSFDEFREDLDFLLATRHEPPNVPRGNIGDYPDLFQLQQFFQDPHPISTQKNKLDSATIERELRDVLPRKAQDDDTEWELQDSALEALLERSFADDDEATDTVTLASGATTAAATTPEAAGSTAQKHPVEACDTEVQSGRASRSAPPTTHAGLPEGEQPSTKKPISPESDAQVKESIGAKLKGLLEELSGQSCVGVDIGHFSLKAVKLRKSARGFTLKQVIYHPFSLAESDKTSATDSSPQHSESLRLLKGQLRKQDRVAVSVGGLEVVYRQLTVPKMNKKELRDAVPWAVRKELPFEIENASIGFRILETIQERRVEKLRIAAVAAPRPVVERRLKLFDDLDVIPTTLTAVPVALSNLLLRTKSLRGEKVLIIEIGEATSHLVFINKGTLEFHREITTAGRDFIDALQNSVFYDSRLHTVSLQDALHLLSEVGLSADEADGSAARDEDLLHAEVAVNLRPVFERLTSEIRRSMDYYREKFRVEQVDRVLVSGNGARIRRLAERLQQVLGLPVQVLNPFESAGIRGWQKVPTLQEMAPAFAVAVGLAVEPLEPINLLPAELHGAHRVYTLRRILQYATLFLVLGFGVTSGFVSLKVQQMSAELARLQAEYQRSAPLREEFLALKARQDTLLAKMKSYRSQIFINHKPVEHLRAISNLVTDQVALTSLSIKPLERENDDDDDAKKEITKGVESITMWGIAFPDRAREGSNLAAFLLRLQDSGYFREVKILGREFRADGTMTFVVQCIN